MIMKMDIPAGSFVDFLDSVFQNYSDFNSNQIWLRLMDPENVSFDGKQMSALSSILIHYSDFIKQTLNIESEIFRKTVAYQF